MSDFFKNFGWVIAVIIAIIAPFAQDKFAGPSFGGASDSGWNATGDGCIAVDGTCIIDASGNFDGTITSGAAGTFGGLMTFNAGSLNSYTNATSTTATTMTMIQADILGYDSLVITPTVGSLTYTLPATSTLTSLVPTAGDVANQCWVNASTTAGITVTIAEGTGWDLEAASSTVSGPAPSFAIGSDSAGCLTYIRKANTDIRALFVRYADN